jgi:flagellar biosynthesis protein FlhA
VHIRDNLTLPPGGYRILLRGVAVAQREIPTNRLLAIAPGAGAEKLPGIPGEDPAFGLPALWIQQRDRERATAAGYAVVDPATAITTHLAEVVRAHASDLLSRQHVRDLLDQLAQRMPRLVDDIVPTLVSLSVLHRTLRQLLSERVSIRDLATILETLAEYAARIQDPDLLTDLVRERLSRTIVRDLLGKDGSLHVLTLDPEIENELKSCVQRSESGSFLAVDAASLTRIVNGIEKVTLGGGTAARGSVPALLCSPVVRSGLRQVLARTLPRLPVLSHSEIPAEVRIVGDGVVR